jgi:energy-coupling factor transporter ATP-binding protein EcfA2
MSALSTPVIESGTTKAFEAAMTAAGITIPDAGTAAPAEAKTLTEAHLAYLAGEGISAEVAIAHKTYSVLTKADLPTELHFAWDGAGIVFTHFLVNGTEVPQYRPDNPTREGKDGKALKYVFPAGIQNGPFVSPLQTGLIASRRAKQTFGAEGTKGLLAVVTVLHSAGAINDIVAVGLPGCWGGIKDGLSSKDFTTIVPRGTDYTVFLDGDVSKKPGVFDAGKLHIDHISVACRTTAKLAILPVAGSNGISDYLGGPLSDLSPAEKLEAMKDMAKAGRKTLGRRPADKGRGAASKTPGGAKVFWDEEVIATAIIDDQGNEKIDEVILDAAIRPTAIHTEYDDLNPGVPRASYFDLEIRVGGAVYNLHKIPSAGLADPRTFLTQLPGALGETVQMKPRAGEDIGEAIRGGSGHAGAGVPVLTSLKRSGWHTRTEGDEKVARYVTGNLAIGPYDSVTDLTGSISDRSARGFTFPDPHELTRDECRDALLAVLHVEDGILINPTAWVMGVGMHFRAVGGRTRTGGIVLAGPRGCGKTSILRALAGLQTSEVFLDTFEGTVNAVAGMGRGLHHAVKHADDFRDKTAGSHQSKDAQRDALSALFRRMYSGSEGVKARERVNRATGEVVAAHKESAEPCFIVTAEIAAMPLGQGSESDLERAIIVPVTKEDTFRPGGAAELQDLTTSGILHRANAAFIHYTALQIHSHYDSFEEYQAKTEDLHRSLQEELADLCPEVGAPRRYEIAANALVGYKSLLQAASYFGAFEGGEAKARFEKAKSIVAAAMLRHHREFLGGGEGYEASIIDMITGVIASGKAYLGPLVQNTSALRLGWHSKLKDGTEGVVLLPSALKQATGMDQQALNVALAPYLVPGPGSPYTRKMRVETALSPVYFIKQEAWAGIGESDEAPGAQGTDH